MSTPLPTPVSLKWLNMNLYLLASISAFSIVLPATMAVIRYRHIHQRYLPFLCILIIGLLNESLSFILIRLYRTNLVNSNIYTLIEYLGYLWFFFRIQQPTNRWIWGAGTLGILIWILDNGYWNSITTSNSIFRIFSSLVVIWLSIDKVTQLTWNEAADRYKKTDLLLCFSLFAYFTFRGFIHVFKQFSFEHQVEFYIHLWSLLSILNILVNCSFFIAILWIPKSPTTR